MSLTLLYSSNARFRATLKTLGFGFSSFAAIFCASAGYGLLKMLLPAFDDGATIRVAEFSTHSGLTILFFALAGIGAYVAKKCFW
jgi:asparagine N-glycosylation enzyme membrane subunit Stt3